MDPLDIKEMFHYSNDDYIINELTILLNTGKININDSVIPLGYTLLHLACQFQKAVVVQFLLKRSANVNSRCLFGHTPLHEAVMNGNIPIAKLLIDSGADDINVEYSNGETLITTAIKHSSLEMLSFLIDYYIDINLSFNVSNIVTMTPLLFAAQYPRVDVVQMLINKGADVNVYIPENRETALHRMSTNKLRFSKEKRMNYNYIANLLIKSGANINAPDPSGESPICSSARLFDCSLVELLVKCGSDLNMIFYDDDDDIRTPFHLITEKIKEPNVINLCLKYGGDYRIIDGCSAYHIALLNNNNDDTNECVEAIRIFWQYGCPFDLLSGCTYDECSKNLLHKIIYGSDDNTPNIIKYQRLMFDGIKSNNVESVKDAIKAGAVARGTSMDIKYPLHFVSSKGYSQVAEVLLESGIKVNNLNNKNETALQLAIKFRKINACKILFQHGACLNFKVEIRNLDSCDDEASKEIKELLMSVYSWFILVKQGNLVIFELMKDLLKKSDEMFLVHLNALDKNKRSLMALAMYYGHREIVQDIMKNRLHYKRKLLELPEL